MAYAYSVIQTSYPCCEQHTVAFTVPADKMEAGVYAIRTCPGCKQSYKAMVAYEPGKGFTHQWQRIEKPVETAQPDADDDDDAPFDGSGEPEAEEKCACGTSIKRIQEFWGEEANWHTQVCLRCGGELHCDKEDERCLQCGYWSGVDAEGVVWERADWKSESRVTRDPWNAGPTFFPVAYEEPMTDMEEEE